MTKFFLGIGYILQCFDDSNIFKIPEKTLNIYTLCPINNNNNNIDQESIDRVKKDLVDKLKNIFTNWSINCHFLKLEGDFHARYLDTSYDPILFERGFDFIKGKYNYTHREFIVDEFKNTEIKFASGSKKHLENYSGLEKVQTLSV